MSLSYLWWGVHLKGVGRGVLRAPLSYGRGHTARELGEHDFFGGGSGFPLAHQPPQDRQLAVHTLSPTIEHLRNLQEDSFVDIFFPCREDDKVHCTWNDRA